MNTFVAPEHISSTRVRVCANRDWRLLTYAEPGDADDDFDRRVLERLQGWITAGEHEQITGMLIERAVIYEYCVLLHRAIAVDQTAAQQRALDEVWNYVTPIIRRVLGDDDRVAACANDVLLTVWRKHGDVREAGTLLGWAAMIASRAALALLKTSTHEEVPFSELFEEGEGDDSSSLLIDSSATFTTIEDVDMAKTLAGLIRKCLEKMRLAAEVVIRLVLAGQPVSRVSRELGLAPSHIHVIKWRGLRRLRTCNTLLAVLDEMLSLPANNTSGGSR